MSLHDQLQSLRLSDALSDATAKPDVYLRRGRKGKTHAADHASIGLDVSKSPYRFGPVWGKDRFWLTHAATGTGENATSELHELYREFNCQTDEQSKVVYGRIVHRSIEECLKIQRVATEYSWNGVKHKDPNGRRPACSSQPNMNGSDSVCTRFEKGQWIQKPCKAAECRFAQRQPVGRDGALKSECIINGSLTFQLRLKGMPELMCQTETKGGFADDQGDGEFSQWGGHVLTNWVGWYNDLRKQWENMGLPGEPNLYGLPIRLSHSFSSGRNKVTLMNLSTDLDPGDTLQRWLMRRFHTDQEFATLRPKMIEGWTDQPKQIAVSSVTPILTRGTSVVSETDVEYTEVEAK